MQIEPRRWPGRVVPSASADVDVAVESLCVRASWPDADRRWVRRLLEPWFAAGWSVDALLVAIDTKPDGTRQGRPRSRAQVAHEFLRARLRTWTADGATLARPPLTGTSLGEWYRVNRRNAALHAPGPVAACRRRASGPAPSPAPWPTAATRWSAAARRAAAARRCSTACSCRAGRCRRSPTRGGWWRSWFRCRGCARLAATCATRCRGRLIGWRRGWFGGLAMARVPWDLPEARGRPEARACTGARTPWGPAGGEGLVQGRGVPEA